jgi:hypothetical protein
LEEMRLQDGDLDPGCASQDGRLLLRRLDQKCEMEVWHGNAGGDAFGGIERFWIREPLGAWAGERGLLRVESRCGRETEGW